MPYIKEDKARWIQEDYIPNWQAEMDIKPFNPEKIAWVNAPQINQAISIET